MGLFTDKQAAPAAIDRVSLFGKHPSAGDFVRHQASGPLARGLDTWLSSALVKSRSLLGPAWSQAFANMPPSPFLFAPAGSPRCLFGVFVTSSDTTGREFPLSIFAELDRQVIAHHLRALPLERFLVDAITLLQRRDTMTHQEIIAELSRLPPPTLESLQLAANTHDTFVAQAATAALFGEMFAAGGAPVDANTLLARIGRAAQTVLQAGRTPGGRYGLRCPLGAQPSVHAALWLGMLGSRAPAGFLPNALWNFYTLVLHPGELGTTALAGLLDIGLQHESLLELRTLDPTPSGLTIDGDQSVASLLALLSAR